AAFIQRELERAHAVLESIREDHLIGIQIAELADQCAAALGRNKKIMIAGNGGSAADAQHWAGELVGRFYYDRPALAGVALTTDTSILTAVANDYAYDYVFARQVEAIGSPGDVLIALSTSGRSKNVIRAIETATSKGIFTAGLTGASGDDMAKLCS